MIPILMRRPSEYNDFAYLRNVIGRLSDTISCEITEELNGVYALTLQYPINGRFTAELMQANTIAASRPYASGNEFKRELAFFDVYHRSIDGGVLTVEANHVSCRLSGVVCTRVPSAGNLYGVLAGMSNNIVPVNRLSAWSEFIFTHDEITLSEGVFESTEIKPVSEYFFDDVYSIAKIFRAEVEYHMNTIHFNSKRGTDRGAEIRFGKNMASALLERDATGSYNAIFPYWRKTVDGYDIWQGTGDLVYPNDTVIEPINARAVDFTAYFEARPTVAELHAATLQYLDDNKPWLARETADVTFDPDWEQDAVGGTVREIIDLGDTVTVFYGDADLAGAKMRVVRIRYDVLLEHFSEFTLGQLERGYAVTSRDGISATRQIMA